MFDDEREKLRLVVALYHLTERGLVLRSVMKSAYTRFNANMKSCCITTRMVGYEHTPYPALQNIAKQPLAMAISS